MEQLPDQTSSPQQDQPLAQPQFFLIGAQKSGTSWLWEMLDQHPETSLPKEKEIHYFGGVELYRNGKQWYDNFFRPLDSTKLVGDGSTTYFYDRVPYWHNQSREIEFDDSIPPIPELIDTHYPDAKYILMLRDPVSRAISAYTHWMKRGYESPRKGITRVCKEWPKMRILEYGMYADYLEAWRERIPEDRLKIIIFEDQVKVDHENTLREVFDYLGLDNQFKPSRQTKAVNSRWSWTRVLFGYYGGKVYKQAGWTSFAQIFDKFDFAPGGEIVRADVEFLRSVYLPEKERLESMLGRDLSCWDYGEKLLKKL